MALRHLDFANAAKSNDGVSQRDFAAPREPQTPTLITEGDAAFQTLLEAHIPGTRKGGPTKDTGL
jgi:hypothetical protein